MRRWPLDGVSPQTTLFVKAVGDLTIIEFGGKPTVRCSARPEGTTAAKGTVLLLVLGEGECAFRGADGRLHPMRRKEVLLADCGGPLELRGEEGSRIIGLAAPAHLLSPRFVTRERLKAGALQSRGRGVAALLYDLLLGLGARGRAAPGAGALADAVGGLLSATLEDCLSIDEPEHGDAARARLDQVGRYLRRNFADPDLTASDVAAAVGVSRRYLHKLFAAGSQSFRAELIGLRIEACLKAFHDERERDKTIAEIAFAAGYTDISQFNRHFRRLKGETPSAVRRAALVQIGGGARAPRHRQGLAA